MGVREFWDKALGWVGVGGLRGAGLLLPNHRRHRDQWSGLFWGVRPWAHHTPPGPGRWLARVHASLSADMRATMCGARGGGGDTGGHPHPLPAVVLKFWGKVGQPRNACTQAPPAAIRAVLHKGDSKPCSKSWEGKRAAALVMACNGIAPRVSDRAAVPRTLSSTRRKIPLKGGGIFAQSTGSNPVNMR